MKRIDRWFNSLDASKILAFVYGGSILFLMAIRLVVEQ